MQETDEEAQQAADLLRDRAEQRAKDALASADATLSAERPWAESAAEWERAAREARELEPDTARTAPRRAPVFDGEAFGDQVVAAVKEHVARQAAPLLDRLAALESRRSAFDGEAFGDQVVAAVKGHVARANAPLLDRIAALESRLAAAEGRLAGVENKAKKR